MLQVITPMCKREWAKTYLQVTAGHEKRHPPDCSRPERERGNLLTSICVIPWYKIRNWCFGLMHKAWHGVEHQQECKWLVLAIPHRGAQEPARGTWDRSENLLDHVSCSGRSLGHAVYSLRATWSHTAANAFLEGLKRSPRTLPEQLGPPLWVFKYPLSLPSLFEFPGLLRFIWLPRRGYPESAKEMHLLFTVEDGDGCGDGWVGVLVAGARGP